jgi:hypothetical protein
MIHRTRPDECLSDFALDRRLGSELGAEEETLARGHIASCPRCAGRWTLLRAERDAFAAEAPALRARALPGRGRPRRWLAAGMCAVSAAVAALVLTSAPEREGTRSKGGVWRLGFYVSHAGAVREGAPGERVQPGDALRFTYGAADARYVAVLSLDGARRASTYYPASGGPRREEPGADVALPLSTVLDDALGEETIYGVACLRPFDPEALRRSLEREPGRAPSLPEGCSVDVIVLHKEAPLRR